MTDLLSQFHKMKMIYNVLLVPRDGKINIYTSYPYSGNHCSGSESGSPAKIATFLNGNFTEKVNLFGVDKYWNMHGCTLTCLGNGQSPDASLTIDKNGAIVFKRTSKELMEILNEKLNFKTEIILPQSNDSDLEHSWFFYNDTVKDITEHLASEQVDFAMGVFSRLAFANDSALLFGKETRSECYTWAVPFGAGQDRSIYANYLGEFSVIFWIFLVLSVLVVVIFMLGITKIIGEDIILQHPLNAFEYTFLTILNQPCRVDSKHWALRIFLAHWLLYVLVLVTAYQASLWSLMTIPWQGYNILSLPDLLDSPLEIAGPQQMYNILTTMPTNNTYVKKMMTNFTVLPASAFKDIIERIKSSRDLALFGDKWHLKSYSQDIDTVYVKAKVYFVDGCLVQSVATPLLFPPGSPLFIPFNTILTRLVQSGLMQKFYMLAGAEDPRTTTMYKAKVLRESGGMKITQIQEEFGTLPNPLDLGPVCDHRLVELKTTTLTFSID
ncbi:hypothetical protein J6590_029782 [Homalodisca vitripennis]|nr:hypothetical protein J6590_029782 [Homalodisca vitripennis]